MPGELVTLTKTIYIASAGLNLRLGPAPPAEPVSKVGPVLTSLQINDAPRVGQFWQVTGVTFSFPAAEKTNKILKTGKANLEYLVRLRLFAGTAERANQTIAESVKGASVVAEEGLVATSPFICNGNLESFSPLILFPGESLSLEIEAELIASQRQLTHPGVGGEALIMLSLGQGSIAVNYMLNYHKRGR